MPNQRQIRAEAIKRSAHWWFCENILNHPGQCGLLRMDFPRVFILIRDENVAYWADFETWKNDIVEVTYFDQREKGEASREEILIDAWNFLTLIEEEEENQYELHNGYKDEDDL